MADQLSLVIEPRRDPGVCECCHGTGNRDTDDLDDDGLWFRVAPCADCNGSGVQRCSASECEREATRIIRAGCCWRACCGRKACTISVFLDVFGKVQP